MPVRLALVSNWQDTVCGVANFGRDWQAALERAGYLVTPHYWDDPTDPTVDFTCYNWHPATMTPLIDPPPARYGVYLHDLPPWSTCALVEGATRVWAPEPLDGAEYLPYPVYDGPWRPSEPRGPTIGWTGVRGDGRDALEALCAKRGWVFNGSTEWRATPQEVARLSASTLIVLWYFASGRGQSLAFSTACATGRPILINDSAMFRLAAAYPDAVYRANARPAVPYLEPAIDAVLDDIYKGRARIPTGIAAAHGWARAIHQMEDAWSR